MSGLNDTQKNKSSENIETRDGKTAFTGFDVYSGGLPIPAAFRTFCKAVQETG